MKIKDVMQLIATNFLMRRCILIPKLNLAPIIIDIKADNIAFCVNHNYIAVYNRYRICSLINLDMVERLEFTE